MKIISDTTCQVSLLDAQALNICLIPNQIMVNNQIYKDYLDISSDDFIELIKVYPPKTSQPALGDILACYENLKDEEAIHITTGKGLSSAYEVACSAKETSQALGVSVIHSRSVAGVNHYLTLLARRLRDLNLTKDDIIKRLNHCIEQTNSYVIPVDLNFLLRSGRLTKAAALIGGFLKLKPVLSQTPDKLRIDKFAITRTWRSAINSILDDLSQKRVDLKHKLYVLHAHNKEAAQLAQELIKERFKNIEIESFVLAPSMISHGGPGCLVIQSVLKDSIDIKNLP